MTPTHRTLLALVVVVSSMVTVVARPAAADTGQSSPGLQVGGKFGLNFSELSQPTDPAGYPTVLYGTAFTGVGFLGGVSAAYPFLEVGPGFRLTAESDALFSYHRGHGFAESRTTDARRDLVISTLMLRVPLLFGATLSQGRGGFHAGLGPELMAGLSSNARATQQGISGDPGSLSTTPATHVGVTLDLGVAYHMKKWTIPVDVRFTYDPFVKKTTRDRFDGYSTVDAPGDYRVAFDWQFFLVTGFTTNVL